MKLINWKDIDPADYLYACSGDGDQHCHELAHAASIERDDLGRDTFVLEQLLVAKCSRKDGESYAEAVARDEWRDWWNDDFSPDGAGDCGMTDADIEALKRLFGDIAERSAPNAVEATGVFVEITPDFWTGAVD